MIRTKIEKQISWNRSKFYIEIEMSWERSESVPLKFEHLLTIQPYLNQQRPQLIVKIISLEIIYMSDMYSDFSGTRRTSIVCVCAK